MLRIFVCVFLLESDRKRKNYECDGEGNSILNKMLVSAKVYITTGIPKMYLPELLERVSAGKVASSLLICVNFKVFSFLMMYNNKKDGAIFGRHITFCAITQYL